MAQKLIAPRMGEGVEELNVVKWLKAEGDTLAEMEPVVEVETDKVVSEIPSPVAGTLLKIMVPQDQPVRVGDVLAWIGEPGEALEGAAAEPAKVKAAPAAPAQPEPAPVPSEGTAAAPAHSEPAPVTPVVAAAVAQPVPSREYTGFVSPLVRKIASEHQVDLNQVKGSGEKGRITKEDILAYIANPPAVQVVEPAPTPKPATGESAAGKLIPHTSLRRQIAERMVNSVHTSVHVLTVMEADLSRVLVHQAANKSAFENDGVTLTLTAYFIAAIVEGLKAVPEANASWTDEGVLLHPAYQHRHGSGVGR